MLAVLLFAGLAAAAILPAAFDTLVDDDDPMDDGTGAGGGKAATLPGDDPSADADGNAPDGTGDDFGDEPDEGMDYEISAQASEAVLGDFDAARDTCTITTDTWDSEFTLAEDPSGKGATLSFTNASGDLTRMHFPGLPHVPVEAISLRIDAGDGAEPTILPLAEVFAAADEISPVSPGGTLEAIDPFALLTPIAPDLPDVLPVPLDGVDPLAHVDPDLPGLPPEDPSDTGILAPESEDDPGLLPGHDPSPILFDPRTGMPIPARINDFGAEDFLAVTLSPAAAQGPLEITISPDEAGTGSAVLIDGLPVATLPGAPAVSPSQIRLAVSV
jgi:hypothetical protein